jgi:hypothetical protein
MENSVSSADALSTEDASSTVSHREQDIKETVERLSLEKELAEAIVNLTMEQLHEAEAMGRLSSRDQARLAQKYSAELARVTKALQKHEQLLTLQELEITQQQLMQAFEVQLQDINQQIRGLKDEHSLPEGEPSDTWERIEDTFSTSRLTNPQKIDTDSVDTTVVNSGQVESDPVEAPPSPATKPSTSKWASIFLVIAVSVFLISSASYTMGLLSAPNSANTGTLIVPRDQLGVYADAACTQPVTALDWGSLAVGEQATFAVFLRNIGNMSCVLQLNVMNWNPAYLADHVFVSWDYAGQVLAVDDVLPVIFTLVVSPDLENVGAFSYDLVITTFS